MLQDLATVAPSVIVCAAFLVGVVALLRRELAPRRRNRPGAPDADETVRERGDGSEA